MSCTTCKFFSLDGCAVNPAYREMRSKVSQSGIKEIVRPYLQPCPDWQEAQAKTLSLTLPEHYWSIITSGSTSKTAIAMAEELEQQIRSHLGLSEPTKAYDHIPF